MIFAVKVAIFIELTLMLAIGIYYACLQPRERGVVTIGDVLLIALIPLVALFGHDKNVFYAFLFVLPLFWIGDPTRLAKRYLIALVSFPVLSAPYEIGGIYLGDWSALFALNAGSLVALALSRRGRLRPVRSIDAALWVIFLGALLLVGRGLSVTVVLRVIVTTFALVVPPYFVVSRAIGSPRAAGDAASFMVLGGVCNACVALVESVKHWSLYEALGTTLNVRIGLMTANMSVRAGFLRAGGAFVNYEILGLFCGMALLTAVAIRRRFTAIGFLALAMLLVMGLLASQARSAWIATAVGVAIQAMYQRRWKRVGAIVAGVGAAGVLALVAAQRNGVVGQIMGRSTYQESTGEYRQRLLSRGIDEMQKHPLTGQTVDQLQVSMNDLRQGQHIIDFVNTHLHVALVGGIGVLLLWLIAWSIPLVHGWCYRTTHRGDLEASMAALSFAMTSMIFLFLAFTSAVDQALPFTAVSMGLMSIGLRMPIQMSRKAALREHSSARPIPPLHLPRPA